MNKSELKERINKIYKWLMASYGPQGWWPIMACKGKNTSKTGSFSGYHPGDNSYPQNANQRFEICVGAILTQNTAWTNVEKALLNLKAANMLSAKKLSCLDRDVFKDLIRPAGYYNQKSHYLLNFAKFFLSLKGKTPAREMILNCKGVGNETADSILLYAYNQLEFVVDAYTRRIYSHLGFIKPNETYMVIKAMFEDCLEKEVIIYQEYHALIVQHAKRYYRRKPHGIHDPLLKVLGLSHLSG